MKKQGLEPGPLKYLELNAKPKSLNKKGSGSYVT